MVSRVSSETHGPLVCFLEPREGDKFVKVTAGSFHTLVLTGKYSGKEFLINFVEKNILPVISDIFSDISFGDFILSLKIYK